MKIHEVEQKDLSILSNLFATTHLNNFEEDWTYPTALSYLEYYYNLQPDLFLVAYSEDGIPIGAVMSVLKPSFDGTHLTQIELFVAEDIKNEDSKNIKKELLYNHLELADAKYQPTKVEVIVPHNDLIAWQEIIKMDVDTSFVLMHSNLNDLLKQLI